MNAPLPTHVPRNRDADRAEAERLVGELNRLSADLRFAADLLFAYQAGLAVSTPDPATGLMLVERIAVVTERPPVDEIVLIWMSDKIGGQLPWLGHMDERGGWWYVDSGAARGVTHWAYRPGATPL